MKVNTLNYLGALVSGASLLAMSACSAGPDTGATVEISSAYAALANEALVCAGDLDDCMVQAGDDMDALAACAAELDACKRAEGPAAGQMKAVAQECAMTHRDCMKVSKGDADARLVCKTSMRECMGVGPMDSDDSVVAVAGEDTDAGIREMDGETKPKKGKANRGKDQCREPLVACVQDDAQTPNACVDAARECLMDSLPEPSDLTNDDMAMADDAMTAGPGKSQQAKAKAEPKMSEEDSDVSDGMAEEEEAMQDDTASDDTSEDAMMDEEESMEGDPASKAMGKARKAAIKACLSDMRACTDAGDPAQDCLSGLRTCRESI